MNAVFKGALVAVTALSATAAVAADGTGSATVELVENLTIAQASGLDFGYVLQGATGTVVVAPDGTVTGAAYLNNAAAGVWNLEGQNGKTVTVTLPASVDLANGTNTLTVNGFTRDGAVNPTLLGTGTSVPFNLGATLNLNAAAPLGVYSGTYTVTAEYQ